MKRILAFCAILGMAAVVHANITYAPFMIGVGGDEAGAPIADGTYVMVIDLDGDGYEGTAYDSQAVAFNNSSSWQWDPDDLVLDRGQIVNGSAYPFSQLETTAIPATYDAGVDHYYVLWFDKPYNAGDAGPGSGVAYGVEDLGTVGADPGDYTPFLAGGSADYQTVENGGGGNNVPVLDSIGDQEIDEGSELAFSVTASDPNDTPPDNLTLSVMDLPTGASFTPATGAFAWTPGEDQDGSYQVTFKVTDDGTPNLDDAEIVTITVNEVNEPPVLDPIGPQTVDEEVELTFTVTASDPDIPANGLTLAATGLPTGATFNPLTGGFAWTPAPNQQGSHDVTFTVTDDGSPNLDDSEVVTITVNDIVNNPPVAVPPMIAQVAQGGSVTIPLAADDPDGDDVTVTIESMPVGGTLGTVNQQAQTVEYTPLAGFSGEDHFTFKATDGRLDSAVVDVYVFVIGDQSWLVELNLDSADFPALYIGADPDATDGYDDDFDLLLPGEIVPTRAVRNFAGLYRPMGAATNPAYFVRDVRLLDSDYFWVAELEAFDEDLNVTWAIDDLPAGVPLRITECDAAGNALTPGDEGTLMTEFSSINVPAGSGIKYYRIDTIDGEEEFLLDLNEGWNLVSIPVLPLDPSVDTIFADTKVTRGATRTFRDGSRGRVTSGDVWDWNEDTQTYEVLTAVTPYQGMWVYVEPGLGDMTIRVVGQRVQEPGTLKKHWNLIGVGTETPVDNADISGSIFYWLVDNYFKTSTLLPGSNAYWLYSFQEGVNLR